MQTRHGRYKRIPALAANGQSEPNGARIARQEGYLPRPHKQYPSGAWTPHLPAEIPARPLRGQRFCVAPIHRTGPGSADRNGTLTAWA